MFFPSYHHEIFRSFYFWRKMTSMPKEKVKGQRHRGQKIFAPIWAFSGCISSLNSQISTKWYTKLAVASKSFPTFFRSSVKSKGYMADKSTILTQIIEHFGTVTPVWIHRWLRNAAQSLQWHRGGSLLIFRASVKFQGHTGRKIDDFDQN